MTVEEIDSRDVKNIQAGVGSMGEVLIVDDHPFAAWATAEVLRKEEPSLQYVVADSASQVVDNAAKNWFRIFIDLNMPGVSGLSLIRVLKERGLERRCCIITAVDDAQLVVEAKRLGVLGFIEKSWPIERFCRALHDIIRGVAVFPTDDEHPGQSPLQLTSKQQEVLRLLHRGLSSKQVAHELSIAEGTVKNHTLALLRALHASNRAHAVARGIELGYLRSTS